MAQKWKTPAQSESPSRFESLARDIFAQHVKNQGGLYEFHELAKKAIEAASAFYIALDQNEEKITLNGAN